MSSVQPGPTVLVPAFRPGAALVQVVADLRAARPDWQVLVVDDGSGAAYDDRFAQVGAAGAQVVTLPVNCGKGAALKAGLAHAAAHRTGSPVVCADADGQHALADIVAVGERLVDDPDARRLVLGTRTFEGPVPVRSRIGNSVTCWLFAAAARTRVPDTQTGLRGIPAGLLAWACGVPGERYEYEMQVLLRAGRSGIALDVLPIATIYLEDNASSHFRPVVDSWRVYAPLLAFLASSLAAFAIDTIALLALQALTGDLLLSVVGARITSAGVNFVVNRRLVFDEEHRIRTRVAAARYAALATALLGLNFLLLSALDASGIALLPAKVLTELALVSTSFAAQRAFVFRAPGALTGGSQRRPTSPTGTSTTVDSTSR
ncbi:glycosyltransferase family 2 protein [Nocardioides KLBMP 9356]|uniref:Glycosyltransferase family 2 protein n=1 Tax=Nocardioides potassii TaxID=2911371 RepID=A0ABS9H606_9ACTN|nr:glycosyltransferase family 2 protein [Nocardioides potassii]MCF6376682.1 glycosyltransferase family 2 protein [Nocardioides potassii]